jgi:hypothetical protein
VIQMAESRAAASAAALHVIQMGKSRADGTQVKAYAPEVLILAPCSAGVGRGLGEACALAALPGWWNLPAVKSGRVYVVDHAFFSRPGPRWFPCRTSSCRRRGCCGKRKIGVQYAAVVAGCRLLHCGRRVARDKKAGKGVWFRGVFAERLLSFRRALGTYAWFCKTLEGSWFQILIHKSQEGMQRWQVRTVFHQYQGAVHF